MSRRAVILAGGKGTRLQPYTFVLPKPLMPIGDQPILEIIIRQLSRSGFNHITLAVNHQAELIKAYFGDGSRWDLLIDYSLETVPMGTMGPLKLIPDLPDHFLIMNGDVLADLSFQGFFDSHQEKNRLFSISSYVRQNEIDYGVLSTQNNVLTGFEEKPSATYEVSMGIYMASRRILDNIPISINYGFDSLMTDLLNQGKEVAVLPHEGYWLDIGRRDDYLQAIQEYDDLKSILLDE